MNTFYLKHNEGSLRQLKDLDERVRIVENAGRDNKSALTQLIT